MTYYNIQQYINKTCPCTALHNMGIIQDPQNSRGIPDKIYMIFEKKRHFKERKLLVFIIIKENEKGGRYFINNIYNKDINELDSYPLR